MLDKQKCTTKPTCHKGMVHDGLTQGETKVKDCFFSRCRGLKAEEYLQEWWLARKGLGDDGGWVYLGAFEFVVNNGSGATPPMKHSFPS